MATKKIDIALIEKPTEEGLTKEEIFMLLDLVRDESYIPVEFDSAYGDSVADGFISYKAAEQLNFDYSDLSWHVGNILSDMTNESEDGIYKFMGFTIYVTR